MNIWFFYPDNQFLSFTKKWDYVIGVPAKYSTQKIDFRDADNYWLTTLKP